MFFASVLRWRIAVEQHGLDTEGDLTTILSPPPSSFLFKNISPRIHTPTKDLGNKPEQCHIPVKNRWARTHQSIESAHALVFSPAAA